jgi:hypothetical protein
MLQLLIIANIHVNFPKLIQIGDIIALSRQVIFVLIRKSFIKSLRSIIEPISISSMVRIGALISIMSRHREL